LCLAKFRVKHMQKCLFHLPWFNINKAKEKRSQRE
jgi:hypothetical protein